MARSCRLLYRPIVPKLARVDWVVLGLGLLAAPIACSGVAIAIVWAALWAGTAAWLIGSRTLLPRFERPRAHLFFQYLDPDRLERARGPLSGYWIGAPLCLCALVGPAAWLSPSDGVAVFAAVNGLLLTCFLLVALLRDRASAKVMSRILDAAPRRRLVTVVSELDGPFAREVTWCEWQTASMQSHVVGVRDEVRSPFRVLIEVIDEPSSEREGHPFRSADVPRERSIAIDPQHLRWASIPTHHQGASSLQRPTPDERAALSSLSPVSFDREQLREGDAIVVVGSSDVSGREPMQGTVDAPLALFAMPQPGAPLAYLRRHRRRRRAGLALLTSCVAAELSVAVLA